MSRPRAYLAGPEVFLADGAAIIAAKNDLALAYGFLPNGIALSLIVCLRDFPR